jgi:hypothetical protein
MYSIQRLFQEHFPAYTGAQRLPLHHHRAARLIGACHTAALGGHVQGCPEGHVMRVHYNACRHRLCTQCAALARSRWLEAERARLLPCAHHHVIFTIPHELNALWRFNQARLVDALFECASATLKTLLADARYLGAEAGWLAALHTWSRALALHPHVHVLVSDGGVREGAWASVRRSHFLPARVVMALFRGKLTARLRALLEAQALVLPPDCPRERLLSLLNRLGRIKWNVRVCPRYAHGEGVLRYLARYVRGGPLKDSQLSRTSDTQVRLRYQPHEGEGPRWLELAPAALLARYLTHTPVPGQHQVRRYGLYAPGRSGVREQARTTIAPVPEQGPAPGEPAAPLRWQDLVGRVAPRAVLCPVCARPIGVLQRLAPARAPPPPRHGH